ncbi:MAG: transposase [Deltaproteobacteria bacterium]|nr:transposase [Deltaproteobacteria bacterium]
MRYRRAQINGGTYFFTVVTYRRMRFLTKPENVSLLRQSFKYVMERHPFVTDAIVILPDHLHCIWTLPQGNHDFSTRWRLLKSHFSRHFKNFHSNNLSKSLTNKKEKGVWQRRFWEHLIRDENDFSRHVEYIHYNPVKHGVAQSPAQWEYSSFHRYVRDGVYDEQWGFGEEISFEEGIGRE